MKKENIVLEEQQLDNVMAKVIIYTYLIDFRIDVRGILANKRVGLQYA